MCFSREIEHNYRSNATVRYRETVSLVTGIFGMGWICCWIDSTVCCMRSLYSTTSNWIRNSRNENNFARSNSKRISVDSNSCFENDWIDIVTWKWITNGKRSVF